MGSTSRRTTPSRTPTREDVFQGPYDSPSAESSSTIAGPSSVTRKRPPPLPPNIDLDDAPGGQNLSNSPNWRTTPSPGASPYSANSHSRPRSPHSNTTPTPVRLGEKRQSGSQRNFSRPLPGRIESYDATKRRPKASNESGGSGSTSASGSRESPLARRLGEEPPFMLPHPFRQEDTTSQLYPGVVLGAFAGNGHGENLDFGVDGMRFDGSMDDILDLTAAGNPGPRRGSNAGQDGNIAPWLNDDAEPGPHVFRQRSRREAPEKGGTTRESRKHSVQILNHFSSVPALPKIRRHGQDAPPVPSVPLSSVRGGSTPHIYSRPSSSGDKRNTTSQDSLPGLNGKSMTSLEPSPSSTRHPSQADVRASRLPSAASTSTLVGEKKKGLFSGFMRRKPGQSTSSSECQSRLG